MAEARPGGDGTKGSDAAGLEDLEQLADLSETLVGFLDPGALAQRAATLLHRVLGLPLISVAVRDGLSHYAMLGVHGARTDRFRQVQLSTGEGMGGRVVIERRPIEVENYTTDPRITNHFSDVVSAEGLGGMVAVPVEYDDELVGILYGGLRSIGSIGDRSKVLLEEAAFNLAPTMAASIRAATAIRRHVDAERQRIASNLHDDVSQLLFSISVAAQCLRDGSNESQSAIAERIERQAQEATQRMRQAFKVTEPGRSNESATVALQSEIDDLAGRSGLLAHLVVRGAIRPMPQRVEAAFVSIARQAFFNIEQHARASMVVATLDFRDKEVSLVIQDDGHGLPEEFELLVIPSGDRHWGLASMLRGAQRLGGDLEVRPGEDGGTTVRITMPAGEHR
ncbi:histidine kinase [Candidatus Poriferisodalis sp.]|uniref:GAF domain-containing sensor histidine kinase n=1 Tax=Candidatus Poriferisodalis sp. TaxID=3101277 RepID=UPI003B5CCFC3